MEIFPVTPATPTGFETRDTGITLEVEPVVGPNKKFIELSLRPELVEFEGFVNYGSPIATLPTGGLGKSLRALPLHEEQHPHARVQNHPYAECSPDHSGWRNRGYWRSDYE